MTFHLITIPQSSSNAATRQRQLKTLPAIWFNEKKQ
jgi:hypothetical protein